MEDTQASESLKEKLKQDLSDALKNKTALQVNRHVMLEITEEGAPPGTFAISFYGVNSDNVEGHQVIIVNTDTLTDFFDMCLRGMIYGRALELVKGS